MLAHHIRIGDIFTIGAESVAVASFVANLLPNSDIFASYPRFKRAYETAIAFISAIAFNFRHRLPSLDLPMVGFKLPECPDPTNPATPATPPPAPVPVNPPAPPPKP